MTETQRADLVSKIAEDGVFEADVLESLTDNQLVALSDPEALDNVITLAANAAEEDDKKSKAKTLNEYSDDEMEAEMASRKKKKGKKPGFPPTSNSADEEEDEATFLAKAPKSVQKLIANARAAEEKQKATLVDKITSNSACPWTSAELKEMEVDQLERIGKLAAQAPAPNYGGRGGFQTTNNASYVEEPLVAPELDFSESSN